MSQKKIVGRECKFSVHIPVRRDRPDVHMVKERIHYDDGTTEPNIFYIKNFKRPFYVAVPSSRSYKQKKEYESLENLMRIDCTQSALRDQVAKALGKLHSNDHLKKLAASPYLYGTDITSTALIKNGYKRKWPNAVSAHSVAGFDIEVDVVNGTDDPIILQLVFENKGYIVATEQFAGGIANVKAQFEEKVQRYLGDHLELDQFTVDFDIAKDPIEALKLVFSKAHEWKPDFLEIWNMNYDIPKLLQTFEKYGVDPIDVLCDPSIPRNWRICKYRQGPVKKVKANGKVEPIEPSKQWHTLELTASFYVIDGMCTYRQIRMAQAQEPSYGLDPILKKELDFGKLNFKGADGYIGLAWHEVMQKRFKVEYMVYALWDSMGMVQMDKKTKDLSYTLPTFAATSDFSRFSSNPKKIADALHYFVLERGYVMASTGYSDEDELDSPDEDEENDETLDLKDWIVTLPAHNMVLGMNLIEEDNLIRTMIRAFVYDSDCTSAYPTCVSILNVSKATTRREIIDIRGIDEMVFRVQNINLMSGATNALEYGSVMFGMPTMRNLLKELT